jgi:tRNA threonylcarbamoyladenosine biosynthesis protein TsaB
MALLLSLETSSQACSVALHNNGLLLASREIDTPRSAASQLAVMIHEVISEAQCKASDLQAIVVASGPGSYTGLRIGVATAKGLCYALNIPLIAINTLQLLGYQGKDLLQNLKVKERHNNILLCPMLDARRMEVYCMLLDDNLNEVEPTQAKIIDKHSFENYLEQKVIYFIGEGATKCKEITSHSNAHFITEVNPMATRLGELGYAKWNQSAFEDLVSFEPFYLKDFLVRKPNLV